MHHAILYAILAFLFPVGIYFLVLAALNRRTSPVLVRGFWDTVGLLLAASGFFLITVPMLLNEFYLHSLKELLNESFASIWFRHFLIWLIYYLLLIGGAAFLLVWRSHKTMIYNVDPDQFPLLLQNSFVPLGLKGTFLHARLEIEPAPVSPNPENAIMEGVSASCATLPQSQRHALLEIENFAAMCHVTLHWDRYPAPLRQEIERELSKRLNAATPLENAAAGWFVSLSGLIFGMLAMILMTFLFIDFLHS